MGKLTRPQFTKSLQPGNLFRTQKPTYVYTVPQDEKTKSARIEVAKHAYFLALSAVIKKKLSNSSRSVTAYRYQVFALRDEQIVTFTCLAPNDRLINNVFEIVMTGDPNA